MSLRPAHRARRFARSVFPRAPSTEDRAWAGRYLSEREARLFDQMATVDRSHSIAVAQEAARRLGATGRDPDGEEAWVVTAALTHDVGKTVAGLGLYGRVVATVSEALGGASMARVWAERRGLTRRVGLYLQYPRLGADLLAVAGSDPRVVAWAVEHHEPEADWSVPVELGRVLVEADDG